MAQTATYYICRLCGYIYKGRPTGSCPACGAPVSSFVPYVLGVEEKRHNLLRLDLHPIATHWGVGLAVLLVLDYLVAAIAPVIFNINLGYGGVLDFLALILPFFVGLTALLGYFDGKLRYKKVRSQFLVRKLWLACVYFGVSIVISIMNFTRLFVIEGILIVTAVILAMILGMIGRELTCNVVPRGHEIASE